MEQKKYLDVKMVGHEFVRVFQNEKTKDNQPDYKADGIAVWVRDVKPKEAPIPEENIEVQKIEV